MMVHVGSCCKDGVCCFQARIRKWRPNLALVFLCSCCFIVYSQYWWMFALAVLDLTFFIARPRDWLGRTCPKWTVLCWVGCKTLTQYSANPVIARAVSQGPVWIDASYLWQAATKFHIALHCTQQRPLKYGIIRGWYTAVGFSLLWDCISNNNCDGGSE